MADVPQETEDRTLVRAPHPALQGYVDPYVGYLHLTGGPGRHHGLPSDRLTVVVAFDDPLDVAWLGREETRDRFWLLASGMHTRPVDIRYDGRLHGLQLSLTPRGARALLGVPARELARDLVDLEAVLPLPEYAELRDAGWEERFGLLDRTLLRALRHGRDVPHRELEHAWTLIGRHHGAVRVGAVADAVGWSRRRLSERFRDEYGVTPKEAARISRFTRSQRLVLAGVPLADVAAESGFADQPHLTREWREMAGYAPREYLRTERPNLQDAVVG